jgi:hypothetical protein
VADYGTRHFLQAGHTINSFDEQYVHQLLFESNEKLQMRWRRAPNIS